MFFYVQVKPPLCKECRECLSKHETPDCENCDVKQPSPVPAIVAAIGIVGFFASFMWLLDLIW